MVKLGSDGSGQLSFGLTALCLQDDLMQTIGVSAALGAAGVVLWGDLSVSSSEVSIATLSCTYWSPKIGEKPCQVIEKSVDLSFLSVGRVLASP